MVTWSVSKSPKNRVVSLQYMAVIYMAEMGDPNRWNQPG